MKNGLTVDGCTTKRYHVVVFFTDWSGKMRRVGIRHIGDLLPSVDTNREWLAWLFLAFSLGLLASTFLP